MTAMFKVQDGVPMPEINRSPHSPRRKFPVADMAVGQMFFVPHRTTKAVSAYISRITKALPGKFTARHVWAAKQHDDTWMLCDERVAGATEGVGVWRVE